MPVFDDDTSMVIEFDLHGTTGDLEKRLEQMAVSIFAIMAVEVPVAWALSHRMGLNGIWVAYPVAFLPMLTLQTSKVPLNP